jgi:hypothetical protein
MTVKSHNVVRLYRTVQLIKQDDIPINSMTPINKILQVSSKNLGVFFEYSVFQALKFYNFFVKRN